MGGMEEAVVEMDSVAFLRLLLLSHLVDDLDHKLWLEVGSSFKHSLITTRFIAIQLLEVFDYFRN